MSDKVDEITKKAAEDFKAGRPQSNFGVIVSPEGVEEEVVSMSGCLISKTRAGEFRMTLVPFDTSMPHSQKKIYPTLEEAQKEGNVGMAMMGSFFTDPVETLKALLLGGKDG